MGGIQWEPTVKGRKKFQLKSHFLIYYIKLVKKSSLPLNFKFENSLLFSTLLYKVFGFAAAH